mgnify:CR=1 FL=1
MAQAGEGSLADSDIAGVFGIEIAEVAPAPQPSTTPENKKEEDWHAKTATEPEEVTARQQESREERVILLGSDVS